ncbi:MAG: hypothetical protein WCH10_04950 [bacterium]
MSNERNFDTLQYANRLKAVGVPEKQAEVQAEVMAETIEGKLATKADIKRIEERIVLVEEKIKELEIRMTQNMRELELRMTLKLGSLMIGGISVLVVLMRLLKL